jgi:hypothetical protein
MAIRIVGSISQRGRGHDTESCVKEMVERLAHDLSQYGYRIVDKDGKDVSGVQKFRVSDLRK